MSSPDPFTDVVAANARSATELSVTHLANRAAKGLALVTCMDARIDPLAVLGLESGDTTVLRNAGARVTEDVLRDLVLSVHLLGVDRVAVMAHTGCRMAVEGESVIHAAIAAAGGPDTGDLSFLTAGDQDAALDADVQLIRSSPYLTGVSVGGFLYDLETGLVGRRC